MPEGREPRPARPVGRASDQAQRSLHASGLAAKGIDAILVDTASDYGIFALDPQGHVLTWNAGAVRLTDYLPDEMVGTSAAVLWTPEDRAEGLDLRELATCVREGRSETEAWLVRKDGSRFRGHCTVRPVLDEGGQVVAFAKVMRDVTRRYRAEQEAKRLQEELRRFSAMVSHELGNQIQPVRMHLHVLGIAKDEAARARAIAGVERAVARMARLTADLTHAARFQMGQFFVDRHPADLRALALEAVEGVRETAAAAGVTLQADAPAPVVASVDSQRLAQVLQNLLGNAVKFSNGGKVTVRVRPAGDLARISVADEGLGLDPPDFERLFEPFTKAHEGRPGMGLGLYVCRSIVHAHDGRLWAESQGRGHGTTFHVELPRVLAGSEAGDPAAAARGATT